MARKGRNPAAPERSAPSMSERRLPLPQKSASTGSPGNAKWLRATMFWHVHTTSIRRRVRAQLNDIFGEKIAQLNKEADEEIKRIRKEGNRVAVPYSVLVVVAFTLFILLMFFGGMISTNANVFHSEWLNDCIWKTIWGWVAQLDLWCWAFTCIIGTRVEEMVTYPK